ncbi:MAG: hypothetical protein HKN75_09415 [Bacteroidia bacterium]|nr:hypothetical protein [Bacteroidia bacterium]
MKPIQNTVITVSLFLLFYALSPHFGITFRVLFALFTLGNVMLVYMVYAVLKYGISPKQKFSEGFWYCDVNKKYSENA